MRQRDLNKKGEKNQKKTLKKRMFFALILIITGTIIFYQNFKNSALNPDSVQNANVYLLKERSSLISILLELLISFIIFLFLIDKIFNTNITGRLFSLFSTFFWGDSRHRVVISSFSFQEIGGCQEAKEELREVISYFHNPEPFHQYGAKIPKGFLLVGPPGNGKTLLAKALAGECRLPFLFRSGSEFEEMLVGLGARRMRELFAEARSYPDGCIIFIDELDSIGKKRHTHNSNDLTLNQLLNELDGFSPRGKIVILAATNKLQVLDSALLRPGRFDRQIYISLPNFKGRQEIIKLNMGKMLISPDVDLNEIVAMTQGFSGAQIVNLLNEANILSLRRGQKIIDWTMIFEAYDRVLMGPASLSHTISPHQKKVIAFHEAGHALVGLSLPESTVKKITIVPRGTAGGYTWIDLFNESGDDNLINKSQILAQIMGFLGGRASEELIFGSEYITAGAYSDFQRASELIRNLIWKYGMSDFGIVPPQKSFFSSQEMLEELPEKSKEKLADERENTEKMLKKSSAYPPRKKTNFKFTSRNIAPKKHFIPGRNQLYFC